MAGYEPHGRERHDAVDLTQGWRADEDGAPCRNIPMVDAQLDSRDLFAAGRLVTIAHGEHTYQLRLTSQNKLILTK